MDQARPFLLNKVQLLELCGNPSYSTVWGWMTKTGFPHPIELGPAGGRTSRVAWIASEVFAWLESRPRRAIGISSSVERHRRRRGLNRKPPRAPGPSSPSAAWSRRGRDEHQNRRDPTIRLGRRAAVDASNALRAAVPAEDPKEPKVLRLAFRPYVNNPGYLNAMRLGAARVDLNGEVAGTVDENEAKSARAHLAGIRKFKKERRREEVPQAAPPSASPPLPTIRQPEHAARGGETAPGCSMIASDKDKFSDAAKAFDARMTPMPLDRAGRGRLRGRRARTRAPRRRFGRGRRVF